jgi:hypothetical protein
MDDFRIDYENLWEATGRIVRDWTRWKIEILFGGLMSLF